MKRYTVKQVAELSGVSVRTLHFYDEIGLLAPAHVGENGYRYYEREQLLQLQQILFYRQMDFPLEQIGKILKSPAFDKVKALRTHRAMLGKNAARLKALLQTIDKTIKSLERETPMKEAEMFKGFSPEKQQEYESHLVDRFGREAQRHIDESKRRMKGWKPGEFERVGKEGDGVLRELVGQLEAGKAPCDEAVQALVERHYRWVCHFWTPNRQSYTGLGQLYLEHPDFRKFYEPYHPKLVDFLAEAMRIYADTALV